MNIKIKKPAEVILQLGAVFTLIIISLLLVNPSSLLFAQEFIPLQGEGYGVFPKPEGDTGIEIAEALTAKIVDSVRYIIGAIAVLIIIISSIKLIFAEGKEEEFNKERTTIIYGIIGLLIVGIAGDLSQVLTTERGGFLRDPSKVLKQVRLFNKSVEIVLVFIRYIIGSIAVIFIVRSGLRLVLMGGNEEEVSKDKKTVAWALLGLLFIMLATPLVNEVFYKIDTSKYPGIDPVRPLINAPRGVRELVGVTNLAVSFVGPFAILSMIAGGIMYIIAGGDEEKTGKAKKIILWALIGIIVIYGSFGLVSTFIMGRFEGI